MKSHSDCRSQMGTKNAWESWRDAIAVLQVTGAGSLASDGGGKFREN